MNKTKIEWTDYTWNPITGCLNNCEYCYARKLANGRLKERYLENGDVAPNRFPNQSWNDGWLDPFYPRFWPERLWEPTRQRKPSRIFTCDMSDLFGIGIPESWTESVFKTIRQCPEHTFQLLTKQPQNLAKWSPFPENCWVGVTATNWDSFFFKAIEYLPKIRAKVKYISLEPLLGSEWTGHIPGWITACLIDGGVDWLIIGQQTPVSAKTQPKIEWVSEIVEAADKAGVKVFLKNNLKPLIDESVLPATSPLWDKKFKGWKLRQEYPND